MKKFIKFLSRWHNKYIFSLFKKTSNPYINYSQKTDQWGYTYNNMRKNIPKDTPHNTPQDMAQITDDLSVVMNDLSVVSNRILVNNVKNKNKNKNQNKNKNHYS